MKNAPLTIARFTFLEAVRNRLFYLTLAGLVIVLGLTEFVGELAITEADSIQATLIAAGMRVFAVSTVSLFVITSLVREFADKGVDLIASMPIPRSSYFFGKFLGFFALALVIVLATGLLLTLYAPLQSVVFWLLSLSCELSIVIALSLLCLFTFSNVTVAFMAVAGFYLLARSMYTIQLISDSPIMEFYTFSQEFMSILINGLAFLLPALHEFTRSEWLLNELNWADLGNVFLQTVIYLVLLSAAALFDLYRKNL